MKRFLIALLAITFLAPATGSVFALSTMEMDHSSAMIAVGMAMADSDSMDTVCDHHTPVSSQAMDCCNPELTHAKIGIWENRTSEVSVPLFHQIRFPLFTDAKYTIFAQHSRYYSTAPPPNPQIYSNLVGIVKRLD